MANPKKDTKKKAAPKKAAKKPKIQKDNKLKEALAVGQAKEFNPEWVNTNSFDILRKNVDILATSIATIGNSFNNGTANVGITQSQLCQSLEVQLRALDKLTKKNFDTEVPLVGGSILPTKE